MSVLAFGGIDSGIYRVLFLLHIVTIVAAFAPAFAHPLLMSQSEALPAAARTQVHGFLAANSKRVYAPALVAAGLFGLLLIVASDKAWEFSEAWVSVSFLIWFAMNGVLHAVLLPAERKLAAGVASAKTRGEQAGMVLTVLFLLMLVMMIWKPGA